MVKSFLLQQKEHEAGNLPPRGPTPALGESPQSTGRPQSWAGWRQRAPPGADCLHPTQNPPTSRGSPLDTVDACLVCRSCWSDFLPEVGRGFKPPSLCDAFLPEWLSGSKKRTIDRTSWALPRFYWLSSFNPSS